jgi:hypothetical protein
VLNTHLSLTPTKTDHMEFHSLLRIPCSAAVVAACFVTWSPPVKASKQELVPLKYWDEKVIRFVTANVTKVKVSLTYYLLVASESMLNMILGNMARDSFG